MESDDTTGGGVSESKVSGANTGFWRKCSDWPPEDRFGNLFPRDDTVAKSDGSGKDRGGLCGGSAVHQRA